MISITEARKILGKKYDHLSDEEIAKITRLLYELCSGVIDEVVVKK